MHGTQQPWIVEDASWHQLPCLPYDERTRLGFSASQGHLSDNYRVEVFLQGIILFGPPVFLLTAAPFRTFQLYHAKLVTVPNHRGLIKLFLSLTLIALQLAYTVTEGSTPASLALSLLILAAYIAVCVLCILEHGRSVAPSTELTIYLILSMFSDLIHFGLLYVARNVCSSSTLPLVLFITRFALLVLESQSKTAILRQPYQNIAPEEAAGFLSTTFFGWVNKIIIVGYSKIFSVQDMPLLPSYLDSMKMREAMQRTWDKRRQSKHRFNLLLAQFRLLWLLILQAAVPRTFYMIFRYCQPLLISRTIAYVGSDLSPFNNRNDAFRLILFTFVIYTGMALAKGMYDIRLHRLNVMSHMTIIGLIHNRCFTIREGVFNDSVAVTLMSNDVEEIMFTVDIFHELWAETLELCIGMYLLSMEIGWVCIVPLLIVLLTSQGSKFVTARLVDRQKAVNMATQMRISIIKAILDSMKNIKMMGLVEKMRSKIQIARDHEISKFIGLNRLFVLFNASATMLTIFSPAVTLIMYAVQAELRGAKSIDVNMAFTSLAIIEMVTSPANTVLIMIAYAASSVSSFDRIQKYLEGLDREDKRETLGEKYTNSPNSYVNGGDSLHHFDGLDRSTIATDGNDVNDLAIVIDDATIRPGSIAEPVLCNINTTMKKSTLIICSGAVGTGKTTLAKLLLGDLPPDKGKIKVACKLAAYCSQTAWLINGTVKDNIQGPLGNGKNVDQAWYKRVVQACDLDEDLLQFPQGDQTMIGSRGITLSGGQKHRVALARAVYARKSMIILDDVLSALDANTESRIIDNLIGPKGLLRELSTTILLITHATRYMPLADNIIIIGENGNIMEQGSWDDLRSKAAYISQSILKEEDKPPKRNDNSKGNSNNILKHEAKTPDQKEQDLSRKTGDITLYGYYFGAIGSYRMIMLLCSMMIYSLFLGLMPYWLRRWAESDGQGKWYYSGIYFLLALGAFISIVMTIANIFLFIAPRSGHVLHARLLRTAMMAPQAYFSMTDTGSILNRFSSDILMIDRRLPPSLLQVGQSLFTLLSQSILLAVVQPLMTITMPFTFVVVYLVQKFYLPTSRQLRFLELEAKALVSASFLETLEGVATIRAFGWQRSFTKDNVKKLDLSLRPWYLMMCLQRWLNVTMDLMLLGIAMLIISFAVYFKGTNTGGEIGIAFNVVLQANLYLLRLVESWTILETSLGAISRLRTFERDILPEDRLGEDGQPPDLWPNRGAISFDNMSAQYNTDNKILKHVSASIEPGTKVGICGRTGSGKSSLLLSLLRLIEIESGTVRIDNLDLQRLSRNTIRSRLITVPQEPMLVMTDTIRQNLDIMGSNISDDDIILTLKKVHLWSDFQSRANGAEFAGRQAQELDATMGGESVETLTTSQNLHTIMQQPDGSGVNILDVSMKSLPLSQGQQQMFSLARAILMRPTRGKVVLLDEATSSVDIKTDHLMQQLIRSEFKEHTVLTIAHRMETIMNSDLILVLDAGKLVEIGTPSELAGKEGGVFQKLRL